MTTWVSADLHLGHTRILEYCKRPFASIDEMDTELIRRWNSRVRSADIIYHLGDFTLRNLEAAKCYLARLSGRICLLPGSHDVHLFKPTAAALWSKSGHPVKLLPPLLAIKQAGEVIVLCHYALRVWPMSHYHSLHLYGHSHGNLPPYGRSLDVGVDCHDFYPIDLEQIIKMTKEA